MIHTRFPLLALHCMAHALRGFARHLAWLAWFVGWVGPAQAQWHTDRVEAFELRDTMPVKPYIVFDQITSEDGIPKGSAVHLFRDSKGYLWFSVTGTVSGPVRYDGYTSKVFSPVSGDTTAFPAGGYSDIAEDSKGRIWFSTTAGLCRFDPATETFTTYPTGMKEGNVLHRVVCDKKGRIWVSSATKLFRFDEASKKYIPIVCPRATNAFTNESHDFTSQPSDSLHLQDLFKAPSGELWMRGSVENGFFVPFSYDPDRDEWRMYPVPRRTNDPFSLLTISTPKYTYFEPDGQGVWYHTWNTSLWRLDLVKRRWTHYTFSPEKVGTVITSLAQDAQGRFWFTSFTGVTGVFDLPTKQLALYDYEHGNSTSPLGQKQSFLSIKDPEGVIWGVSERGLWKMDPRRQWVNRQGLGAGKSEMHSSGVEVMYFDTLTQSLYSGHDHECLSVYNFKDKKHSYFCEPNGKYGLFNNIWRHGEDILFTGKGLWRYSPQHQSIRQWDATVSNIPGLQLASINAWGKNVAILPDGDLYIPTREYGLLHYDRSRNLFSALRHDPADATSIVSDNINMAKADQRGRVWIATPTGFSCLHPKTGKAQTYYCAPEEKTSAALNEINWLEIDAGDSVWLSTHHGLWLLAPGQQQPQMVEKIQFYCGRIFSDHLGHLWFKYADGIGRYHTATQRLDLFDALDGLYCDLYDRLHRADNGEFFFRAHYHWRPEDVPRNTTPPQVVFTSFQVMDEELKLDSSINYVQHIVLSHHQNFFSISFAALDFSRPEKNEYAYILEGINDDWVYAGNNRTASYTSLPPGQYVFRVKGANNHGVWSTEPRVLHITITPAWYQTTLFRSAVVLALLGLIGMFYRYRIREISLEANLRSERAEKERAQAELLQKEAEFRRTLAETEMAALRAQMNPHFIFNCLNSIRLYTKLQDSESAIKYLTKFSRLIRLILENSRSEKVSLANELNALELYIELESMRFKEKLAYHIEVDPEIDLQYTQIPPLLIQPYVENAVWHGLMQKMEGGTITIVITQPAENLLEIQITDDGIGREKAMALKSKSAVVKKSFGMQVTAARLKTINELYGIHTQLEIQDLMDAQGAPAGTKVILKIPV